MPAGVRTRCDLVVELILEQQELREDPQRTLRLTLLGCGPAREIGGFVERQQAWPGSIRWTLIDQEEEALSLAWRTARPLLSGEDRKAELRCLTLSFTQLLQEPGILPGGEGEDFIGCSGLFDYLREPLAQRLLLEMYRRLAPGGRLAIGNAIGPDAEFWSPEMVLDWHMIYRTDEQMRALAALLPAEAQVEVREESGGAYYFLIVRRPMEAV
jgi:extracellular factor (EF) 3-hydroxypalmitic acid methyl ester biosynthesis protein